MNRVWLIKELTKKIATSRELMKEFPQYREEYLEDTLTMSKIVYQLMKEALL
jgi:hypothetical protein